MYYKEEFEKRINIFSDICDNKLDQLKDIENLIVEAISNGNKVLTAGNGGSAANAQHVTGDIVGRYKIERDGWPAVSLTVDPSVVTALSNDYGYERVFERQVEAFGNEGDLLIVLSSSATSKNLVEAAIKAKKKGLKVIGVLGNNGGDLADLVDLGVFFDFKESDLVEETSMAIFHIILIGVEKRLVELKEVK